jgi:hypothetical protein
MFKKCCISLVTISFLLLIISSSVVFAKPVYEDDTNISGGGSSNSSNNSGSNSDSSNSSENDFNFNDKDLASIDEVSKNLDEFIKGKHDGVMWGFGLIRDSLVNSDDQFFYISAKQVTSKLNDIIRPIAYLVAFIAWLVAVGHKGIVDGELLEIKEVNKLMITLIISLSLIVASDKICMLILGMCDSITLDIVKSSSVDFSKMNSVYATYDSLRVLGAIPFIGPVVQMIFHFAINVPFFMEQLMLSLVSLIVNCVIIVRMVKLCIYQSLSPAFFGLGGNSTLGKYFENFIIEFIITALEIVIMAVVYVVMVGVFASEWGSGHAMISMAFPIVMTVFVVMMLGAHKYIARLFGRS